MSLTAARGPLGPDPSGRFSKPIPDGVVYIEPHPRRVQAFIGDRAVIDTERAQLVHRVGSPLSYAFPAEAVISLPTAAVPEAPGYVSVPWGAAEAWFEEGRRLVHYPPNPYHRVDCRRTKRRLVVEVAGVRLVDTDETVIVFETSVAPRLYVRPALVRMEMLHRGESTSYCNYKGDATYWRLVTDDSVIDDVAWSYEEPLAESLMITGLLSFDPDRVEVRAELPEEH